MFFEKTLDIGSKAVRCTLAKKKSGCFSHTDQRGRHKPHNKTTDARQQFVKDHITSFPKVQSHYSRKDTNREFLQTDLTIRKMHELYKDKCKEKGCAPVSEKIYRNIFCESFNLSFHTPKKDQCPQCVKYAEKEKRDELTGEDKQSYNQHQERKTLAREEKAKDKELAKTLKTHYSATFDLEAVLSTPCSKVSVMFYKRKLSCYNLSFYSLGNQRGTCYLWDESEGGRGSSEIGTCLIMHLQSLPATTTHVSLFSDTCSGQNRNQYVACGLWYSAQNIPNLKIIDQKFLETGHTHMECDSMHSAIEFAKKNTPIYVPSQWDTVIRMARRKNPYVVVPMKHTNFYNLKELASHMFRNVKIDIDGKRVAG